jgi:hypothetical protein
MSILRVSLSWLFYLIGHLWGAATNKTVQNWFEWPYYVYQWFMTISDKLQGGNAHGPWGPEKCDFIKKL